MTVVEPLADEVALWARAEEQREGCRYQRDFHAFLTECCWTTDEASGGDIALFPNDPYIREICDYLIEEPLLFLEKSRRVRMTWTVSAFDLWIAAGGQDPRWPATLRSTGHRLVLLISKKSEDAEWVLGERIRFIYEQATERGLREKWPGLPEFDFTVMKATASNGSAIRALPQGEKQVRQFGSSLIHYEELAHSDDARDTLAAALPTMMGKDGLGGKVVAICTPQVGSFAYDLREGAL